jgi:hypothetical protein
VPSWFPAIVRAGIPAGTNAVDKVRCADCGYLSVRDVETRQLAETEIGMRRDWKIPLLLIVAGKNRYEDLPICFANAVRFDKLIPEYSPAKVVERIELEFECSSFIDWQHGLTPKEHREMMQESELRKLQEDIRKAVAAREDQRDKENRDWQAEQSRERRKWETEIHKTNRRWQLVLAILAGVVGLIGVIIGKFI